MGPTSRTRQATKCGSGRARRSQQTGPGTADPVLRGYETEQACPDCPAVGPPGKYFAVTAPGGGARGPASGVLASLSARGQTRRGVGRAAPVGNGASRTLPASTPPPLPAAGTVRRVLLPPGKKLIALTFDLCETSGETAGYDGSIIDYLRSQQVKATFFAGGHWMASHKGRTQQLLSDPLFEMGTHGWAHRNTRLMSGVELQKEILGPSAVYASLRTELSQAQCAAPVRSAFSAIPDRPSLFRFPFGACSAESLAAVAEAGLIAIQWDVATGDRHRIARHGPLPMR